MFLMYKTNSSNTGDGAYGLLLDGVSESTELTTKHSESMRLVTKQSVNHQ